MTKQNHIGKDDPRQGGAIESYNGRGVWVPDGLTAVEIMAAAEVLERDFDVAPYTSRNMAIAVMRALRGLGERRGTLPRIGHGNLDQR